MSVVVICDVSMTLAEFTRDPFNSVLFTEDKQSILICKCDGLSIVSCTSFEPVAEISTRDAVSLAAWVPGTCLVAVVVEETNLHLYNAFGNKFLAKWSSIDEKKIVAIRLTAKRVVVLTNLHVYVLGLADACPFRVLLEVDRTPDSPNIVCGSRNIVAFPQAGGLCVININTLFAIGPIFHPHTSPISAIEMNDDLLATASIKGTLVRVFRMHFHTNSIELIHVFRRGRTGSPIRSLALSRGWLCVTGDSDTAHVFKVPHEASLNSTILNFVPRQYKDAFEALRDFCFVKLRRNESNSVRACVRDGNTVVVIAEASGYAFEYDMDLLGGECRLRSEYILETSTPSMCEPCESTQLVRDPKETFNEPLLLDIPHEELQREPPVAEVVQAVAEVVPSICEGPVLFNGSTTSHPPIAQSVPVLEIMSDLEMSVPTKRVQHKSAPVTARSSRESSPAKRRSRKSKKSYNFEFSE